MAAAADDSVGLFSAVWSRLRAVSFGWRRRRWSGDVPGEEEDDDDGEDETTVRSRLVRRAAAARRVARKLAFLSFNLEVLVFVYAFWRAKRRNLSWRQPIQALPVLAIPALATLIYTAFIRFTRRLDLKDQRRLKRLQEEKQANDDEPRKFNQNELISAQNCCGVNDASNSLLATDSTSNPLQASHSETKTCKRRKRCQPRIISRGDGETDMSWGHSKDFQPMPSDGLRKRRFSSGKTYTTISGATESIEEKTQKTTPPNVGDSSGGKEFPELIDSSVVYGQVCNTELIFGSSTPLIRDLEILPGAGGSEEVPAASTHLNQQGGTHDSTEDTVCSPINYKNRSEPVISGMLAEPRTIYQELAGRGGEDRFFDNFFDRGDSCLAEHGMTPLLTVLGELPIKVIEENSPSQPEKLEMCPVSIKEAPASPSNYIYSHSSLNIVSPIPSDPVLSASENFEKLTPKGGNDESLLASHKSEALEIHSSTPEKIPTSCAIDDNGVLATSDEDTNAFSYICNDANINAASPELVTANPELNNPTSPELLANSDEVSNEELASDLHFRAQNDLAFDLEKEDFLDPPVVDTAEHSLATPRMLLHNEGLETTKPNEAAKRSLSESQDDGPYNHLKSLVNSSCDDSNTQDVVNNLISVHFVPDDNMKEGFQGGQETQEGFSMPLDQSTCNSEGIFLSSSEIDNDVFYPSSLSPNLLHANMTEDKSLSAAQGGLFESEDETTSTFLATPILLDEDTRAENWTKYPGSSQCIPDKNEIQSLYDGKEVPYKTSLELTFGLEERFISPEESINPEKYSLYSRSSSCVSEINMMHAPRGSTSSEPENGFSLDARNPMMFPSVNSTESCTDNLRSADFFPEISATENLGVAGEAMGGLLHEDSSNIVDAFGPHDIGNDKGISDDYLDLLSSSSVPLVDAFEALQTGQEFSRLQCENDFTFQETKISFADINNSKHYLTNAIDDLQQGLPESQYGDICTLQGVSLFPEEISDSGNCLTTNCASGIPSTMQNHQFGEKALPDSPSQYTLSSKEALIFPVFSFENLYMARQEEKTENHSNTFACQEIPDANISETLQAAEKLSPEMLHEGILSTENTLISVDEGNNADSNNSSCVLHDTQIRTVLGLQEILLKPQDENTMAADLKDIYKAPSKPHDVNSSSSFSGTCNFLDEAKSATNHPFYSRSTSMPEGNLVEIPEAGQGGSVVPDGKNCCSFEETLMSEISSNSPRSVSCDCMREVMGSPRKGLTDPLLIDVHSFDMVSSGEERENKLLNESTLSSEQTASIQAEVNSAESFMNKSRMTSYAPRHNCIGALESFDKGFSEPQCQEPEITVNRVGVGMPSVDGGTEAEKCHDNTRCSSSHDEFNIVVAPQELSTDVGTKVFPKVSEVHEWHCMDKEPKDGRFDDMEEDLDELDEDDENNPTNPPGVAGIKSTAATKFSAKLYAKDVSRRDSAMGISNDFEVARAAGLRLRKQVFTINNSSVSSSTVSELADMQYNEPVDNVADPLSAPVPLSNDLTTHLSLP